MENLNFKHLQSLLAPQSAAKAGISSLYFDASLRLVWASEISDQTYLNCDLHQQQGRTFYEIMHTLHQQRSSAALATLPQTAATEVDAICTQLAELHQVACCERKVVNYLEMFPASSDSLAYLHTLIPMQMSAEPSHAGYLLVISDFSAQPVIDLLTKFSYQLNLPQIKESATRFSKYNLTNRQHEIVFLMSQNLPQTLVAKLLKIHRGSLTRIVADLICPKFKIDPPSYKHLITMARKVGFQNYVPPSLRTWRIINFA